MDKETLQNKHSPI